MIEGSGANGTAYVSSVRDREIVATIDAACRVAAELIGRLTAGPQGDDPAHSGAADPVFD